MGHPRKNSTSQIFTVHVNRHHKKILISTDFVIYVNNINELLIYVQYTIFNSAYYYATFMYTIDFMGCLWTETIHCQQKMRT